MRKSPSVAPLRVLYLCYLSLDDPLTHTQVVAYLTGLAGSGHVVHLLTFESRRLSRAERKERRAALARRGIRWHHRRYHKRPSLPATAYDTIIGAVTARWLARRHDLHALHARSHVAAAMALVARLGARSRLQLLFDIRGLLAEEYVDAGRWVRDGLPFRITQWLERQAIAEADAIVVLTERLRDHLFGTPSHPGVFVIPCCANTSSIEAQADRRQALREALDVGDRPLLVYVGKLTGWYMAREMMQFFAVARDRIKGLHLLLLTQEDATPACDALEALGIPASGFTISSAPPEELGGYLAAADVAISFIRPCFSKISSSPTKIGEYLAAGLPIVCGPGIGDVDDLLSEYDVGVVVDDFSVGAMQSAIDLLSRRLADGAHRTRCMEAARQRLSLDEVGIPAYLSCYAYLTDQRHAHSSRRPYPYGMQVEPRQDEGALIKSRLAR